MAAEGAPENVDHKPSFATSEPDASREGDHTLSDVNNPRTELLSRVQNLKKDLQDWREKLDSQVKNYRQELGELRSTLNSEVEQLRNEFQDLRNSLKRQLDSTSDIPEADKGDRPCDADVQAVA